MGFLKIHGREADEYEQFVMDHMRGVADQEIALAALRKFTRAHETDELQRELRNVRIAKTAAEDRAARNARRVDELEQVLATRPAPPPPGSPVQPAPEPTPSADPQG